MSEGWSIYGKDAELKDLTDVPEKLSQVPVTLKLDQLVLNEVKERIARHFSTFKVGFLTVSAPKPEDVKIEKKELKFIPFWRVYGTYACRYVRRSSYTLEVGADVEEVKINGRIQLLVGNRKRLSDLVAEVGSSTGLGYGPLTVSLTPLEGAMKSGLQRMLGGRDKELGRKVNLTIESEELASFAVRASLCENANIGGEDKKVFEALEKAQDLESLSRDVKSKSAGVIITKDEIKEEFKKIAVKKPDIKPCCIIEHEVRIDRLDLIYVPIYDFTVEAKGQRKRIRFNPITDEDYILTT